MLEGETQVYTTNSDGSVSIKADGKTVKYVLESDLGAVKAQLKDKDSENTKLITDLASANTKSENSHQEVLKERAAKEQFEKSAGEATSLKTKVDELTVQVTDLNKVGGERDNKLTERLRKVLTEGYKVDKEKIKDKTLSDLESIESTLVMTGVQAAPANYDGKGAGGSNTPEDLKGKSPLALATMGYADNGKNDK